jgi:hypothetical protein
MACVFAKKLCQCKIAFYKLFEFETQLEIPGNHYNSFSILAALKQAIKSTEIHKGSFKCIEILFLYAFKNIQI